MTLNTVAPSFIDVGTPPVIDAETNFRAEKKRRNR